MPKNAVFFVKNQKNNSGEKLENQHEIVLKIATNAPSLGYVQDKFAFFL